MIGVVFLSLFLSLVTESSAFVVCTNGLSSASSSSWIGEVARHHRLIHRIETRTKTSMELFPMESVLLEPELISTQVIPQHFQSIPSSTQMLIANMINDKDAAEALAGPFFGASLLPYLAFLYFLNVQENNTPKGVTVGFATCLLFVFLTIPAAIAAKFLYGVSLADCDYLHGSAESMLTITNLATVIPFRQALNAKVNGLPPPKSSTSYAPMISLVAILTVLATGTVVAPIFQDPGVHTPYLNGIFDVPFHFESFGAHSEPENALTVGTWIIHVSSLVEFLACMGFCWRWASVVQNPTWKGLTWGLLPLHSSGITACVSHLLYNQVAILVPLQALLTCIGNTTAAYAAYRIAISNGWKPNFQMPEFLAETINVSPVTLSEENGMDGVSNVSEVITTATSEAEGKSLVGFEDLGEALQSDNDFTFVVKLFAGCALFSYLIKYGELFFDFPFEANLFTGLTFIFVPTALNAYKWNQRSKDPTFEGWF